ncbi:MAG: type II secretion system protein [Candidatus Wallbacteria bacterium]|nr:type II secretion system protein [Candidatus Wallbacteria bacterium]
MRQRSKGAMTLVELVVVTLIFSVLSGVLWSLWVGGNRSFEDSSAHATALRSASLAIEWVRRDLTRIAVPRRRPPSTHVPRPVRLGTGGEVEIAVLAGLSDSDLKPSLTTIDTETVTYRFDPAPGKDHGFHRNGRRLAGIELEQFQVEMIVDSQSGAPFVRITAVGADPAGRKTVLLRDLVYLQQLDNLRRYPSSVPNWVPALAPLSDPAFS